MKSFPTIPHWAPDLFGQQVIAFDKLDGSNMRFEWSKKRGFYKFGTRKQMITEKHPHFGDGVDIFMNKYSEDLERIFTSEKEYRNTRVFTVFAEYLGPNSFAGQHEKDDIKDVILFDICQYKRGIIPPREFVNNFGNLDIPDILYDGELTSEFIYDVKNGVYPVDEGVMVKGSEKRKGKYYSWMAKIKCDNWLRKLKNIHPEKLLEDVNGNTDLLNGII